jgi:hypothetical protein
MRDKVQLRLINFWTTVVKVNENHNFEVLAGHETQKLSIIYQVENFLKYLRVMKS